MIFSLGAFKVVFVHDFYEKKLLSFFSKFIIHEFNSNRCLTIYCYLFLFNSILNLINTHSIVYVCVFVLFNTQRVYHFSFVLIKNESQNNLPYNRETNYQ